MSNNLLCSHELYVLHHQRWSEIKALESDVQFADQLDKLTTECPEVKYCAWFEENREISRRLLRRLAKMEEESAIS